MAFNPDQPRGRHGQWSKATATAKRAAVVAGLTAAGVVAGAAIAGAAGGSALPKGRPLEAGESTVGRVVFTDQDKVTPLGLLGHDRALKKAARDSKVAAMAARIDDAIGLPRRHYGVGVGGGRIVERMNRRGIRAIDTKNFARGGRVMVDSAVPVKTNDQIAAFNDRYEKISARPKQGEINPVTDNCEHTAREIGGQGRYSLQSRVLGGIGAGAVLGGGTAAAVARKMTMRVRARMRKKKR